MFKLYRYSLILFTIFMGMNSYAELEIVKEKGQLIFAVEKSVSTALSGSEKRVLKFKIANIESFFRLKILQSIPTNIQKIIEGYKFVISVTKNQSNLPAGLFLDPTAISKSDLLTDNPLKELHIRIKFDSFIGAEANRLVTHEFFHAIHYIVHPNEKAWVREGLAQLFEYIVIGRLNGLNFKATLNNPYTPIDGKYNHLKIDRAQYGRNMLYFYYLYRQCGKERLFWRLVKGDKQFGIFTINRALRSKRPVCQNFSKSALSFSIAIVHNEVIDDNYSNPNRYYYYRTTDKPKLTKGSTNPSKLRAQLKDLVEYAPIKIMGESVVKTLKTCKRIGINCRAYLLELDYPYRVRELTENSNSYDQIILIKTK